MEHRSVLLQPTLHWVGVRPGGLWVDATCGLGGHTEGLLQASAPDGRVLAIDRDPRALERARIRLERFSHRLTLVCGRFGDVAEHVSHAGLGPADGVIADLGVSSLQLDDADRGFSLRRKGPLDMRMGTEGETAAELLERVDEAELARIFARYGEVKRPRQVARAVLRALEEGRLETTVDLARVIEKASGGRKWGAVHPATQAFQAIRVAVNRELEEVDAFLQALPQVVRPGGRVAIISFHSLEDRRVKQAFADPKTPAELRHLPHRVELGPWEAISKVIVPDEAEVESNPRARSAKLRAARRREEQT